MISFLCPTRARPAAFRRMVTSVFATTNDDVEILGGLTHGDTSEYEPLPHTTYYTFEERVRPPAIWNALAAVSSGDMLVMIGDDCVLETEGWDDVVRADVPEDGIYVAYTDTGTQGMRCYHPIVGRGFYEACGLLFPEIFDHFFVDPWIEDVARRAGRLYPFGDLVMRHLNVSTGLSPHDAVSKRNRLHAERDRRTFHDPDTVKLRARWAERVTAAIRRAT